MYNHPPLELADILRRGFSGFLQEQGPCSPAQYKAVNAITSCRTASLGGHVYRCGECSHERIAYNSCRNRHCPKCQALARAAWVGERIRELLPVDYFHVVFTIPGQLNAFALRNKKVFYNLLFKAASQTLSQLAADKKWIHGEIGFIAILHTWGQNLMDHPHLHCVVPGGGLVKQGKQWKHCSKNFLFPVKVIQTLFRGKFLAFFSEALAQGSIQLHGNLDCFREPLKMKQLKEQLYNTEWIVYVKPPFAGPEAVLKYLGRYTHRIAISNQRLIRMENGNVTFSYKDYADGNKRKTMTLSDTEFIRRFLLHVLPDGFMRIRHYGFLGNRNRTEKIRQCMKLLGKKPLEKNKNPKRWQDIILQLCGKDPGICPVCGKGKMEIYLEIEKQPPGGLSLCRKAA
jgi:hypothetical protein